MASSSRSGAPRESASSSSSIPSGQPSRSILSSFRASPSPSATSQSDDPDRDEEEDDEEEQDDYTDVGSSNYHLKERRNTLRAKGSAALPVSIPATNSSESWSMSPANARNASAATLPHEILLHIFKYVAVNPPDLRKSLTVCKAWCLCGVGLLWHRPSFYRISSLFKLIHIIRRPDQTFPYASYIRRLNLSLLSTELEDSLFGRLAVCTRLERLTLTGCSMISDDTIAAVLSQTKHLVAADFSEVPQLTDKSVLTIAQNCPRLQGINITGCKNITSDSIAVLARNCKLLRRVKLCGCELMGDKALAALAQHCPVLLEVDLINCPLISDSSVREMWKHSFHMRELRLAQCGKLTDLAFPAPNSSVVGMSASNVVGIGGMMGSGGLEQVTSSLQQGQNYYGGSESAPASRGASPLGVAPQDSSVSLSAFAHQSATSSSQDAFPRTSSIPPHAPMHSHLRTIRMFDHLRILDLTNCSTISDAAIDGIVSNVPRIRNLILAKCTRLTNESVYSIARLGKNLHFLHLGHVSNLTDRAICHLARSCTRLRYIDLACCPQLTDLSVLELAANLPKLRRIGLVRVANLTDQAIYSLVDRFTSLERIHLSYCENVSIPAIYWLLERLSGLTHLSLTGVPAFRTPELQAMCRQPPKEFNAHQRSAFCVYSGKGVNELRKYLHMAYSEDNPNGSPFGELSPEVRRARESLAEGRGERRHHHARQQQPPSLQDPSSTQNRVVRAEHRAGVQHHQTTLSDPQHSRRNYQTPQLSSSPIDPHQARFGLVGPSNRPHSSVQTNAQTQTQTQDEATAAAPAAASSSSSLQGNAMQVDSKPAGAAWEGMDEDEEGENEGADERNVSSSASFAFQSRNGSSHLFNGPPASSSSSASQRAPLGLGRTLGGHSDSSPRDRFSLSNTATRAGTSSASANMAALATPPLSSSVGFFSSMDLTPTDPSAFSNNDAGSSNPGPSLYVPPTTFSRQLQSHDRQPTMQPLPLHAPNSNDLSSSSSPPPSSSS